MMGYGDMASYGWIWMTVGIGFWIGVVAFVVRAVTRTDQHHSVSAGADEILRRRYASGEINENDFESARRTLRRT